MTIRAYAYAPSSFDTFGMLEVRARTCNIPKVWNAEESKSAQTIGRELQKPQWEAQYILCIVGLFNNACACAIHTYRISKALIRWRNNGFAVMVAKLIRR